MLNFIRKHYKNLGGQSKEMMRTIHSVEPCYLTPHFSWNSRPHLLISPDKMEHHPIIPDPEQSGYRLHFHMRQVLFTQHYDKDENLKQLQICLLHQRLYFTQPCSSNKIIHHCIKPLNFYEILLKNSFRILIFVTVFFFKI